MKHFNIVIVGLGPTGGTLGNLLAMHGLSILIIEKENSSYQLPRAVHFDDEVMRVFDTIGIASRLRKKIIINKGTRFIDRDGKTVLDWPRPKKITENGWYPSYRFHQPDLERLLYKQLRSFKKVKIIRNSSVVKITEKVGHVEVEFICSEVGISKFVKADYLVGCDGSNSTTRESAEIKLDNLGFSQRWAVTDLILRKKKKSLPDRTIQFCNHNQPATYCRNVGNRRRWEFALKNEKEEVMNLSEEFIWNFLKPWLLFEDAYIERKTVYVFNSTLARKWRRGRIFIAGDAAHTMPPFMGQGMCAGIRDVSNLAWKIAYCIKNKNVSRLLDTYETERKPNVQEYIQTTMKMGELINAIGTDKITDSLTGKLDGSREMQSIKPELGSGLGSTAILNRGKVFPSILTHTGKKVDGLFSLKPVLFCNDTFGKNLRSEFFKVYNEKQIPELTRVFKDFDSNAILVRPDRFILASKSKKENLETFFNKVVENFKCYFKS